MPVRISDLLKMGTKHYNMVAAETMARHAENFQARAAIVKSVVLEDTEVITPRLFLVFQGKSGLGLYVGEEIAC